MQWLAGKPHLPSFLQAKEAASYFAWTVHPTFHTHHNSRLPQDKKHHWTQTELSTTKGPLPLFLKWGAGGEQKPAGVMYEGSKGIPKVR